MNEASHFYQYGYVVIKNFITESEACYLSEYVDSYVTKFGPLLKGKDINWLDRGRCIANSVHKTDLDASSPVTKILHSNRIKGLVNKLLGEEAIERCAEFFCKPARIGLASPMHQDNFYWCLEPPNALTVWLSLTGADISNGGVAYYPSSHQLGDLPHGASNMPGSSQRVLDDYLPHSNKLAIPALSPGDILIHHAQTIHGSSANTSSKDRRGITFQYQGKSCSVNKRKQQQYLSSLMKQVTDREYQTAESQNAGI